MEYRNPIVPGYNPDPSVCRMGDTFYLVTSSFEFFPGVPLYKSKNLVNWELTGHVLDRESQLPLHGSAPSGGIFAPTIRYHDGLYYMITTNVNIMFGSGRTGNFIVHAEDPAGPWSEPVYVDQFGIDPSLFWDDDGRCYFCGTGHDEAFGGQGIVFFETDPLTGAILSEKKFISHGSGGKCPEGPHLYKRDGWYYLMLAEGGTEYGHMETIARSRSIEGPYEFSPHGPLLTCRNYSGEGPIQCTGHADLFDDADGSWWVVCLGTRPTGPMLHHLGRETFLAPVTWEDGWPRMANGGVMKPLTGAALPAADTVTPVSDDLHADFTAMKCTGCLPKAFTWLRNPVLSNYGFENGLQLRGTDQLLSTPNITPTWLGIRQTQFVTETTAVVSAAIDEGTRAGLTAYYMHTHHYDVLLTRRNGQLFAQLRKHLYDMEMVTAELPLPECRTVRLKISSDRSTYTFAAAADDGEYACLGTALTAGLATEVTEQMTFTGTFLALFAELGTAAFQSLDYRAEWEER